MTVSVQRATHDDRAAIAAMLTPYLIELNQDTTYPYLDLYWREPHERFPYLIHAQTILVGFALVRHTHQIEMAEFYVQPAARRTGVGDAAVTALLAQHPGPWSIAAFPDNASALGFWRAVLNQGLNRAAIHTLTENQQPDCTIFYFESRPSIQRSQQ